MIIVGLLSVLEALFQIFHAESISNVVRQLLTFLKQVKKSSLLNYISFIPTKSFHPTYDSDDSLIVETKLFIQICCYQYIFFSISVLSSSILSMTMLSACCSSGKISGPSNHGLPCSSCCRRLAGSINPLVHISAGFIFPSLCCQSPASLYSEISATQFATYALHL